MAAGDRDLDIVVFGAAGFVGRLVAGYLAGHAPGGVRIGLAGRSQRRLNESRIDISELVQDCVQMHGGIGVTYDHDIHLYLRRITVDRLTHGTPADHRQRIAALRVDAA